MRHIPDTLANIVHRLMAEWKVHQVILKKDGKHTGAPEGTSMSVSGIKIPCIYFLYGAKARKSSAREKIKQCQKDLNSKKYEYLFYESKFYSY